MKKRKICVITGTRAEYGLLNNLMKSIDSHKALELQIIVTGMHLSHEFGLTYTNIENDGFKIDRKIEMLLSSDTPVSISKSTGLGLIGFADAFSELKPDMVFLLGDRFEILAASIAATFSKIPISHISGGETTIGAYDESIRHAITKMAWWHFVAAEEYKKRVIQMGENPKRVFNVGGLGVDAINKSNLLNIKNLKKTTGIDFGKKNLLVTYHPETLKNQTPKKDFQSLLEVLDSLKNVYLIFTMANADSNGRIINKMIKEYVDKNKDRSISFISMGHINYLSTLQFIDGIIGNSSSGIAEAPTFKIGTVNVGDRQKGRLIAKSVINCEPTKKSIGSALNTLFSKEFQLSLHSTINPYGDGNATEKIMKKLILSNFPVSTIKQFYDL